MSAIILTAAVIFYWLFGAIAMYGLLMSAPEAKRIPDAELFASGVALVWPLSISLLGVLVLVCAFYRLARLVDKEE